MAELYGAGAGAKRCPGDSCPRFRSTAGKPAEVKRKIISLCTICEGRGPVEQPTGGEDEEDAEAVARIERLARERDTCCGLDRREVDSDDYELLLLWDACVASHERAHQARVKQMVELMLAQFTKKGR